MELRQTVFSSPNVFLSTDSSRKLRKPTALLRPLRWSINRLAKTLVAESAPTSRSLDSSGEVKPRLLNEIGLLMPRERAVKGVLRARLAASNSRSTPMSDDLRPPSLRPRLAASRPSLRPTEDGMFFEAADKPMLELVIGLDNPMLELVIKLDNPILELDNPMLAAVLAFVDGMDVPG